MDHIRDHKIAKLLKQKAAEYFQLEAQLPLTIVDAELIDRRTLHIYYQFPDMQNESESSIELKHRMLLEKLPKLRHYLARNTALKAIPSIHLKLSIS